MNAVATHGSVDGGAARVLVVDDDRRLATALARALGAETYAIDVAHDLGEALDRLEHARFLAVISDLDLGPGESDGGCQVLCLCKLWQPRAVRVLMTGRGSLDVAAEARHVADAFLPKPFRLAVLSRILQGARVAGGGSGAAVP